MNPENFEYPDIDEEAEKMYPYFGNIEKKELTPKKVDHSVPISPVPTSVCSSYNFNTPPPSMPPPNRYPHAYYTTTNEFTSTTHTYRQHLSRPWDLGTSASFAPAAPMPVDPAPPERLEGLDALAAFVRAPSAFDVPPVPLAPTTAPQQGPSFGSNISPSGYQPSVPQGPIQPSGAVLGFHDARIRNAGSPFPSSPAWQYPSPPDFSSHLPDAGPHHQLPPGQLPFPSLQGSIGSDQYQYHSPYPPAALQYPHNSSMQEKQVEMSLNKPQEGVQNTGYKNGKKIHRRPGRKNISSICDHCFKDRQACDRVHPKCARCVRLKRPCGWNFEGRVHYKAPPREGI